MTLVHLDDNNEWYPVMGFERDPTARAQGYKAGECIDVPEALLAALEDAKAAFWRAAEALDPYLERQNARGDR